MEDQNFNAWGSPRNPFDWSYTLTTNAPLFDCGFTGHEHLPEFNLINMKGRIYDPMPGRYPHYQPHLADTINNFP